VRDFLIIVLLKLKHRLPQSEAKVIDISKWKSFLKEQFSFTDKKEIFKNETFSEKILCEISRKINFYQEWTRAGASSV